MKKLKLITILGTRPELIRLSEVIKACDRAFDHILVHTGQNYDEMLSEVFFRELALRPPDHRLDAAGETLGETLGNVISRSWSLLRELRPDALLVLGDTNSALAAISAKRLKIPVFHMEAGNRCYDENLPEELNRRIIDHIADINLSYTQHARRYLLAEGIRGERIFVTGSPMGEVLERHRDGIEHSDALDRLGLLPDGYFLASVHREENVDDPRSLLALAGSLNAVAEEYALPVVYSMHPRSEKRIREQGVAFHPLVQPLRPFGFFDYVKLQKNACCVLSDSGTLSEESAILGFPAVLLRTSTERPEAVDAGTIVIGGREAPGVLQAVELARAMERAGPVPDYSPVRVSERVAMIIQSYTEIIRKNVWGERGDLETL